MTLDDSREADYAEEIRSWLLGRVASRRHSGPIARPEDAELPRRAESWWIFEGKRYRWLEGPLSSCWTFVDHQFRRLLTTYNPTWRTVSVPEGETDWIATAFASTTASQPLFVSRASQVGLSRSEQQALLGWQCWISRRWQDYIKDVGPPQDCPEELPWQLGLQTGPEPALQQLRRWAHTAKRSRWPLLRNVVAESIRCGLEPQELDRLPLPSDHATLFELVCMVRILDALEEQPSFIRWLDPSIDNNSVRLSNLTLHFQHYLQRQEALATYEFDHGLRESILRYSLRVPHVVDGLFLFDRPRCGFSAVIVESKGGSQEPDASFYQLKCYRAALKKKIIGRFLVWGITESTRTAGNEGPIRQECELDGDLWIFCSADQILENLRSLGLANADTEY